MDETNDRRWVTACAADAIEPEDALRVELEGKVYAVFHTRSGFYATEGCVPTSGPTLRTA